MSPAPAPDPQVRSAVAAWRRRLLARLAAIALRAAAAPPPDHDRLDAAIAAWRRRLAARLHTLQDPGDAPATESAETSPEPLAGPPAPPDEAARRRTRRSS